MDWAYANIWQTGNFDIKLTQGESISKFYFISERSTLLNLKTKFVRWYISSRIKMIFEINKLLGFERIQIWGADCWAESGEIFVFLRAVDVANNKVAYLFHSKFIKLYFILLYWLSHWATKRSFNFYLKHEDDSKVKMYNEWITCIYIYYTCYVYIS